MPLPGTVEFDRACLYSGTMARRDARLRRSGGRRGASARRARPSRPRAPPTPARSHRSARRNARAHGHMPRDTLRISATHRAGPRAARRINDALGCVRGRERSVVASVRAYVRGRVPQSHCYPDVGIVDPGLGRREARDGLGTWDSGRAFGGRARSSLGGSRCRRYASDALRFGRGCARTPSLRPYDHSGLHTAERRRIWDTGMTPRCETARGAADERGVDVRRTGMVGRGCLHAGRPCGRLDAPLRSVRRIWGRSRTGWGVSWPPQIAGWRSRKTRCISCRARHSRATELEARRPARRARQTWCTDAGAAKGRRSSRRRASTSADNTRCRLPDAGLRRCASGAHSACRSASRQSAPSTTPA